MSAPASSSKPSLFAKGELDAYAERFRGSKPCKRIVDDIVRVTSYRQYHGHMSRYPGPSADQYIERVHEILADVRYRRDLEPIMVRIARLPLEYRMQVILALMPGWSAPWYEMVTLALVLSFVDDNEMYRLIVALVYPRVYDHMYNHVVPILFHYYTGSLAEVRHAALERDFFTNNRERVVAYATLAPEESLGKQTVYMSEGAIWDAAVDKYEQSVAAKKLQAGTIMLHGVHPLGRDGAYLPFQIERRREQFDLPSDIRRLAASYLDAASAFQDGSSTSMQD